MFCNFVTTNDAGETIFDPNGTYDENKPYLPNASGNVVLDAQLPATEAAKGYANAKTFMAGNSAVYTAGKNLRKRTKPTSTATTSRAYFTPVRSVRINSKEEKDEKII